MLHTAYAGSIPVAPTRAGNLGATFPECSEGRKWFEMIGTRVRDQKFGYEGVVEGFVFLGEFHEGDTLPWISKSYEKNETHFMNALEVVQDDGSLAVIRLEDCVPVAGKPEFPEKR